MTVRISVECWMTSADGDVLLLHVPASAEPPEGFWQPLTGGIEPSEQPVDAAVREVREETGIKVEPAGSGSSPTASGSGSRLTSR